VFPIGLISAPAQVGLELGDECAVAISGLLSGRCIWSLGLESGTKERGFVEHIARSRVME
jgi:hypothetical protein